MTRRILVITLLSVSVLCLSNCGKKRSEVANCVTYDSTLRFDLVEGETIGFPLDSVTTPSTSCLQLFRDASSGKTLLAFMNKPDHSIYLYGFDDQKMFKKIQLQKKGPNAIGEILNGFYVHNLDSIFIISRYVVSIVDTNGTPFYSFDFKWNNPYRFTSLPQVSTNQPARFSHGILTMNSFPDKDPFNENTFDGKQCVVRLDLKKNTFEYDLEYPENYRSGIYGPNFMVMSNCIINSHDIVYSFPTETCIYTVDDAHNIAQHYGGSNYLPNILPMEDVEPDYEKYNRFYLQSPAFGSIYYNNDQQMYYRFAEFPRSEQEFMQGKVWKKKSIIILDKDFKKLGETRIDENLASTMCFNDAKGLFIAKSTASEDTLYFTNLVLKPKGDDHKTDVTAVGQPVAEAQLTSGSLEKFLKETKGSPAIDKAAYLIIPVDQGCGSCIEKSLAFVNQIPKNAPVGVVLTSSSLKTIKRVQAASLSGSRSDLIIDSRSLAVQLGVSAFPVIVYPGAKVKTVPLNAENIDKEFKSLKQVTFGSL